MKIKKYFQKLLLVLLPLINYNNVNCQYSYNDYVNKFKIDTWQFEDSREVRLKFLDSIIAFNSSLNTLFSCCSEKTRLGDYIGATNDYSNFLSKCKVKKDSVFVLTQRGAIEVLYNKNLALEDFSLAIKLTPSMKGYLSRAFVQKEPSEALADYDSAIKILGSDSSKYHDPYWQRGTFKYGIKDYSGAILDLYTAIKIEPLCGECYNTIAKINQTTGKVDCNVIAEAIYAGYPEYETLLKEKCPSFSYKKFVWAKWRKFCSTLTKDELKKMKADMKSSKRKEHKGL